MISEIFHQQIREILPKEAENLIRSLNSDSPTSIRFNPLKNYSEQLSGESIPWAAQGVYLQERPSFTLDPAFHAGAYYVQEASSMVLEQVFKQSVDTQNDLLVLDLCAAPGGKSSHLLSLMSKNSLLVANEVIKTRANILAENLTKWGQSNVVITNNDPSHFDRLNLQFDVIVIDAPCSGEGLFRRDPEAMKEWSPDAVKLCATRQQRILADIWPALKPGGVLIYSTCTYNELENEQNLQWLKKQYDVEPIEIELDKSWGFTETVTDQFQGFHAYPHKVKGEGFFITAVRKTEGQYKRLKRNKKPLNFASKRDIDQVKLWLIDDNYFDFILHNDLILALPEHWKEEIHELNNNLHIITEGLSIGRMKGKKLIPHEGLALSVDLNKNDISNFELDLEQAIDYLRKDPFDFEAMDNGWNLVTYLGLGLGWANRIQQRVNNYYPTNWRIRMGS